MPERYAVYYAPLAESPLGAFGRSWIGRCAEKDVDVEQPRVDGVKPAELFELTRSPRHYGVHATLVAPFELDGGVSPDDVRREIAKVVNGYAPFVLSNLSVVAIGSFLAIVPKDQSVVESLAESLLKSLHRLRKPPTLAELERYRTRGLSPAQERLLARWGYPYVLDEYKFHITLTNSVVDKTLRKRLMKVLSQKTEKLLREVHPVGDVCIFRQPERIAPFVLEERIGFGVGGGRT